MNEPTFSASGSDPKMIQASLDAQKTFKYFWRELSWEYRRIIPALDVACVKVAFTEDVDGEEIVEHMWINEIDFDGQTVFGNLVNDPNDLSNIKNGDFVEVPLSQISDWMFTIEGKSYGGFTVQAMRSDMDSEEKQDHDEAWGVDFGDFNNILLVYQQKEHPENLIEHPMSKNMKESLKSFIKENPEQLINKDDAGFTFLHRETIAGNLTSVETLLQAGANPQEKTMNGHTALDFARNLNWEHIIPILEKA